MRKIGFVFLAFALLACNVLPTEPEPKPEECSVLDFETGFINRLKDYEQGRFIVQYIVHHYSVAEVENGALRFKTEEVYFQFEVDSNVEENTHFQFFNFNGVFISADYILDLVFVGDDFDTLKVFVPGFVAVPDTLFRETTQIHAYGRVKNFVVDSLAVCAVEN